METLGEWSEFNVAMVGATAALAGLVIVAASVNIAEIVKEASLTARLGSGIAGLILALSGSALGLIPGITAVAYGGSAALLALAAAAFSVAAARRIFQNRHPANRFRLLRSVVGFLPPAAYLGGSIAFLADAESAALVAFAAGSIIAIVVAVLVSWIVLVEVLR